jgi:hypothetical protein
MPKYLVNVCRTAWGFNTLEVEADSPEQAKNIALDEAGNHLYSEKESEYTCEGVFEKNPATTKKKTILFVEYLQNVRIAQAANRDKSQRNGQIHFNVLHEMDSELANSIRGGDLDPFHNDDRISDFLDHVQNACES